MRFDLTETLSIGVDRFREASKLTARSRPLHTEALTLEILRVGEGVAT